MLKQKDIFFLGLDTGYARLGYSLLCLPKNLSQPFLVNSKLIETSSKNNDGERLMEIEKTLTDLIINKNIHLCALEEVFIRKNISTGTNLLQARGVLLLILAKQKIPVYSVSPTAMKKMVTGFGSANKKQIQRIVMKLLNLKTIPEPDDIADAIALSLCAWLKFTSLISKKE